MLQLHHNLVEAGINPSEVTGLLSHLLQDHAGRAGNRAGRFGRRLSFPKHRYVHSRKNWLLLFEKGFPSFITEELECLQNNSQVEVLYSDGMIDGYIEYQVTGAHSPFHQVFLDKGDNDLVFYGGDEAPQLQQMKHRFVAKYDADGRRPWNYDSSGGNRAKRSGPSCFITM